MAKYEYVIFLLCAHRACGYIFCAQAQRKNTNSPDFSKTADTGSVMHGIWAKREHYEHNKQMHVTNFHKLSTQTLGGKIKRSYLYFYNFLVTQSR